MACQSPIPGLGYELEAAAAPAAATHVRQRESSSKGERGGAAESLEGRESRSPSHSASTWHDASGADSNTPLQQDYKSSVFLNC